MRKTSTLFSLLIAVAFTVNFASAQNAVADSSFEAGTPSASWTESSTNFGTPLCDANCGTCGGPCAPRTGSWYAWFGGFQGGTETGVLSQSVTIPASANTTNLKFHFFIAIPNGTGTDFFAVLMGTDTVFVATDGDSTTYGAGYTEVTVNAEAYEGTTTMLTMVSTTSGNPGVSNFLVDDVSIGDGVVTFADEAQVEKVRVYPTPATEDLNVEILLGSRQDIKVDLVNLTGAVVYSTNVNNVQSGKLSVDVREFAAGTYFLNVYKNDGVMTQKVTIQ